MRCIQTSMHFDASVFPRKIVLTSYVLAISCWLSSVTRSSAWFVSAVLIPYGPICGPIWSYVRTMPRQALAPSNKPMCAKRHSRYGQSRRVLAASTLQ
jgi:hypothetical protein